MPRDTSYRPAPDPADHSPYAREILGGVPHWTVRWGTAAIFAAVGSLILVAWWIRYPDALLAPVTVTSPVPPAPVVARQSGKLAHVLVQDQQVVEAGTLLAVLENPGELNAMVTLRDELAEATPLACEAAWKPAPTLGGVQEAYAVYQSRCTEYLDYLLQDAVARQREALTAEQREVESMLKIQTGQSRTLEERVKLAQRDLARLERLRASGTVAEKHVDDQRGELLDVRRARQQLDATIAATRIDLTRLQRDAVNLSTADSERRQVLQSQVEESHQRLLAQLAQWEQDFTLRAPIAGRVSFFDYWSASQVVSAGEEVMTVVPQEVISAVGKLRVPLENAGKLAVGQVVHIRLDGYPYEEYGLVRGEVSRISLVPRQKSYAVEVSLPTPLVTSSGKRLSFIQGMEGQADIITTDTRLLQRLFRTILAPLSETLG